MCYLCTKKVVLRLSATVTSRLIHRLPFTSLNLSELGRLLSLLTCALKLRVWGTGIMPVSRFEVINGEKACDDLADHACFNIYAAWIYGLQRTLYEHSNKIITICFICTFPASAIISQFYANGPPRQSRLWAPYSTNGGRCHQPSPRARHGQSYHIGTHCRSTERSHLCRSCPLHLTLRDRRWISAWVQGSRDGIINAVSQSIHDLFSSCAPKLSDSNQVLCIPTLST